MKRIITQEEIIGKSRENRFTVDKTMIITPLVREFAQAQGITLVYGGEKRASILHEATELSTDKVVEAVVGRVMSQNPQNSSVDLKTVKTAVLEAIQSMEKSNPSTAPSTPPGLPKPSKEPATPAQPAPSTPTDSDGKGKGIRAPEAWTETLEKKARGYRAVITATGMNRPGIVAKFTQVIAQYGTDILDISQTIVEEFYTMIIVVDISPLQKQNISFRQFKEKLEQVARSLKTEIMVVHEDILNAMHRV